jgi:hypothetical protein
MATRTTLASSQGAKREHDYDVQSWTVRTGPDRDLLGTVHEVLLDEQGRARYLEVDLDDDDRTILVPVGYADRDPDEEEIWISSLRREDYETVPSVERDKLRAEDEDRLSRAYDGAYTGDRYYESPHFRSEDLGPERRRHTGTGTTRTDRGHETEATSPADREGAARTRTTREREVTEHRPGRDTEERVDHETATTGTRRDETVEAPARVDSLDDIEVADDDPDPRGWTVVDRDGENVGRVDHLLGDTRSMKVRYFVVELDRELTDGTNRMLVPAGHASLDHDHDHVVVRALDRDRIGGAPGWAGDRLDREHERKVVGWFDEGYRDDDRYHHPRYRSDRRSSR